MTTRPSLRLKRLAACSLTLLLGACAVGPDYQRPDIDLGQAYKESARASDADAAANRGWIQVRPADAMLRSDWWLMFNDPVLTDLMQRLQESNLSVVQAEAQYRQAQALLQSARSGFFPVLGSSASATRSGSGASDTAGGQGVGNQYSLTGNVSWEPDLWGKVRRSVESSRAGVQASAADVAATRLSMQSTLAQTYFRARVMDAETRLLRQTVEAYERSLAMTQNRYSAGVAAQADVEVSRTQLENDPHPRCSAWNGSARSSSTPLQCCSRCRLPPSACKKPGISLRCPLFR